MNSYGITNNDKSASGIITISDGLGSVISNGNLTTQSANIGELSTTKMTSNFYDSVPRQCIQYLSNVSSDVQNQINAIASNQSSSSGGGWFVVAGELMSNSSTIFSFGGRRQWTVTNLLLSLFRDDADIGTYNALTELKTWLLLTDPVILRSNPFRDDQIGILCSMLSVWLWRGQTTL